MFPGSNPDVPKPGTMDKCTFLDVTCAVAQLKNRHAATITILSMIDFNAVKKFNEHSNTMNKIDLQIR